MTVPVQGLAASLCDLAPEHLLWARAAQKRLVAHGFEVTLAPEPRGSGNWYLGENLAFDPLREPPLRGAPAEELVQILSAHEEVLSQIETALGVAAEFADRARLERDWPVLTLGRLGEELCRIAVMVPIEETNAPNAEKGPTITPLGFVAARLTMADAEALEEGDLIVLTQRPWSLADAVGALGEAFQPGQKTLGFDPQTGIMRAILSEPAPEPNGAPGIMSSSDSSRQLSVPVTIHLANIVVTQADLDRMAQSGTFDLGAVSEGLSARLSVGGRAIGSGEIVRLGDRFAVLLDQSGVTDQPAVPSETESMPETGEGMNE